MKIAYFASSRFPSYAANSVQVLKMCQAFAAMGHEVELYARRGNNEILPQQIFAFYGVAETFRINLVQAPMQWAVGGMLFGQRAVAAMKQSGFKPDIVYGRNIYALLACSQLPAALYFEAHDIPSNPGRRLLEKILFTRRNFTALITINQALHDYYLRACPILSRSNSITTTVAHDGADLPVVETQPHNVSGPVKIGYAGGLYPGKGIEIIAAAAAALPECEFHIAGGSDQEVLCWQTRCRAPNLHFHCHLEHARIPAFLAGCDILVAPFLRRVTTNPQGIGNIAAWMSPLKIFEYMASRRPIIASQLPAIEEILSDGRSALLVNPDQPAAWSAAIARLAADSSLQQRLAASAFADFKRQYTWQARAEKVLTPSLHAGRPSPSPGVESAGTLNHPDRPLKCLHIIVGLNVGGAENMLVKLVTSSDRRRFEHRVISMLTPGPLAENLETAGIEVRTLAMTRTGFDPMAFFRLVKMIRELQPDLVHTWMYYADIFGGPAALACGSIPVISSIRHGGFAGDSLKTIISARIAALLSHVVPERIVACSRAARDHHVACGYAASGIQVIGNGFTLPALYGAAAADGYLHHRLGIAEGTRLIGMIGRYYPAKDHAGFIKAARIVRQRVPNVAFILCGDGVDGRNSELTAATAAAGLNDCCYLLGHRDDSEKIMANLTFLVSSSASEAFANVIGEAMAQGLPCVVTDVGDSAHIVGDTGIIVPPGNSEALAAGMLQLLAMSDEERRQLGKLARARVRDLFSLDRIVEQYEKLYLEVSDGRRKKR